MRMHLAFGVAVATIIGVAGCNNGGGSSKRAAAAAASTGSVTSNANQQGGGAGGGASTSADAPRVTGLSPGHGPVDGGTAVIISGSNFAKNAGETLVLFGTRAVVVTPTSDTTIQVTAPAQAQAGTVDVRVINDLGVATLVGAFRYDDAIPSLTFSPSVGSADLASMAGTEITIHVKGFGAPLSQATVVEFGATAASVVEVVDAATVKAQVPYGVTPGPTSITVTDGAKSATAPGFTIQGQLAYGDLVVNEVFFHPDSADPNNDRVPGGGNNQADEFVEIVNTTSEVIDITWLHLVGENGVILHKFANPTTLPPGGAIVVFSGGNPNGFAFRHQSGHAQTSTNMGLGLRNDPAGAPEPLRIEDPNHPDPVTFAPQVLFNVELTSPGVATSYVNRNDGQRITANPATAADYEPHPDLPTAQGTTVKFSPGKKKDGSDF